MLPIFNGQKPPMSPAGVAPPQGPAPSGPPQAGAGAPPPPMPPGGPQGGPPPGIPPALLSKLAMMKAGGAGSKPAPKFDAEKVSPETSGYMGPEDGPFHCGGCGHFQGPNSCAIVAGPIDPDGCCNLFTPGDHNEEDEDMGGGLPGPGPEPTEPV